MSVFAVAVLLWLLLQLLAFSWPARAVKPMVVLAAVPAGMYGCTALAFGLQSLVNRTLAAVSGEPLARVVERAGYGHDPFLEEFAKLAPLVVLVVSAAWARQQWGLTDHLVIGGALGAGFGFLEVVASVDPAAADPVWAIGSHLCWTALGGLGVGVLTRWRGPGRLAGGALVLLAGFLHIRANLVAGRADHPLAGTWADILAWLLPVAGLAIALLSDARVVRAGKRAGPDLLLADERAGVSSARAFGVVAGLRVPYSTIVVARYVRLRRSVYYAGADLAPTPAGGPTLAGGPIPTAVTAGPIAAGSPGTAAGQGGPGTDGPGTDGPIAESPASRLWRLARSVRADLDAANQAPTWRRLEPRRLRDPARAAGAPPVPVGPGSGLARVVAVAAAVPVCLFVFAGSIPAFDGLRRAMLSEGGTVAALLATVAGGAFLVWRSIVLVRVSRQITGYPLADPVALVRLNLLGAVGTIATGVVLAGALVAGIATSAVEPVPGVHLHLMTVLPNAPTELLCWLALGFLPVAAIGVAPPAAVTSAAVGGLGSIMLRLAGDRGGGMVAGQPAPGTPPARLDRSMRQLRPSEQRTALLLARQERFRGRTFRRPDSWSPAAMHVDWVDDAGGRYDAYGDRTSISPDGDMRRFLERLDMHMVRDVDYTVVDLTGLARWQVAVVAAHLENLPPGVREHLHKVVRVGF